MVLFMVFAFGMWLATAHPGFRWSKGIGLMGLLCVVFCLYYGQIPYPNSLWEGCYGTLLAFGFLFAADALSYLFAVLPRKISAPMEWCGRHSLELYLAHEYIFDVCTGLSGFRLSVRMTMGFVLSFLAAWLLKQAAHLLLQAGKVLWDKEHGR